MPIINQPKPSEPKSPQPDQQPLQPGQTATSNPRSAPPERTNLQVPESTGNEWREKE